jgi:hypothetical protein
MTGDPKKPGKSACVLGQDLLGRDQRYLGEVLDHFHLEVRVGRKVRKRIVRLRTFDSQMLRPVPQIVVPEELSRALGTRCQLVGDDLFVTNPRESATSSSSILAEIGVRTAGVQI